MTLLGESFSRNNDIDITIKNAFEQFINQDNRTATSLVYFLDEQFKKEFKGLSEQLINEKLHKVIRIFRYLDDKDIFEGFYKVSLAKRLLEQRSLNEDAERAFVLKLKEECGFQFTQKLEVMFKDIKMSEEIMGEFKGSQFNKNLPVDLSVKVLTTGNWPNDSRDSQVTLPKEIQAAMTGFSRFYMSKHTGRKLKWKPSLGNAELRAFLGDNYEKKELIVSTYQMCILLLFNAGPKVSYSELLQKTQI